MEKTFGPDKSERQTQLKRLVLNSTLRGTPFKSWMEVDHKRGEGIELNSEKCLAASEESSKEKKVFLGA